LLPISAGFPAAAQPSARLEEIVITAERRPSTVQETPSSVTVFGASQLQASQIDDLRNVAALTSGLVIGGYAAFGDNPISIRGIGQNPLGVGADDPVAIYLDGVYLGRSYSDLFDSLDVQRIEVLKGPQGTLYGRNATGGAINIITRTPSDDLEAIAETRFGNFGERLARILLGGPIVQGKVAAQVSFSEHHLDGYATNRFDGSPTGNQNGLTASAKLVLTPSDKLTIDVAADADRFAVGLDPKLVSEANQNLLSVDDNYDGSEIRRNWGISATVDLDLDWSHLTSISAFRRAYVDDYIDQDGTAADILKSIPIAERQNQISEEIRLASPTQQTLSWIIGASYYREHANSFGLLPYDPGPGVATLVLVSRNETDSYAAFGTLTWAPIDRLTFSAGLRYTYEEKAFTFYQLGSGLPVFATIPQSLSRRSNDAFTPKFTAQYRFDPTVMTYLSIGRGFKSGGFASYDFLPAGAHSPDSFQPEDVWAYEAGIKTDLFDRRLRIDLSLFHEDFANLQVRIPDTFGFISIKNAASANIDGAELEAAYKPSAEAEFTASIGRLQAQYSNFIYTVGNIRIDNSGKYLIRAPRWKGAVTGEYRIELPGLGSMTPRVEYTFEGHSFYEDMNSPAYGHGWIDLWNAWLTFKSPDRRWSASLYGINLGDKIYVPYSVAVLGQPLGFGSQPRTFGIDLRYEL
jgi:iron complex outermembrane receptor protein